MSKNLLKNYCKKIDELAPATFNEDQKILAKKILEKADEKDLQNIFQMLIQRIKIGFTFDVAPTYQKEDEQSVALLKKDENRSFKNYENTSNIENTLIIGENYDALKNLLVIERERESSSHSDAYYDVIYIDPPYNTESAKDDGNHLADEKSDIAPSKFVYRDKFSRNGWLNMLNERLRLAKQLLKDDGVIFVSLDDNEQAYLKILMDEIFGEENFVSNIVWVKKWGPGGNTSFDYSIVKNTEYILCYARNINNRNFGYLIHNEEKLKKLGYTNKDKYFDERGYYKLTFLFHPSSTGSFQYIKSLDYPILAPDGTEFNLHVNKHKPESGCYTWSYDAYKIGNKLGFIEVKKNDKDEWVAFRKQYQFVKFDPKSKQIRRVMAGQEFENIIDNIFSQEGGADIVKIFSDKNKFDFPKPTNLIKYILKMSSTKKNIKILDFYAGSGTTGHAVMELNKEDGGNRTYTLVTNNENNIGYDVCYERIYRINNGIGTKGESFEWTNKNKPYKQNLNVFSIEYYDTSILKKNDNDSIAKIKKTLAKEIEEFGITPSTNFNVDIYYDLLSLKPILKEDR